MIEKELTALERTVLNEICRQYPKDRALLEKQVGLVSVTSRRNTGAGFFTDLSVLRDAAGKIETAERVRGDVQARLEGLECEMGFILFLEDGFLSVLEGYLLGDGSTMGLDLLNVGFEITVVYPPIGN